MNAERLIEPLLRYRRVLFILVAALTALFASYAVHVEFDHSIEIWFLDDDPTLVSYQDFLERFGADELVVIGVFANDVFTPPVLAAVDRATRAAEDVATVHRVRSLTNVRIATGASDTVAIDDLIDELPSTQAAADDIRERALANATLRGTLVAANSRATAIVIEMDGKQNSFETKSALVHALEVITQREIRDHGLTAYLSGAPAMDQAFEDRSTRDYAVFAPLTFLLIVVVAYVLFRRWSAALVPLSVVLISAVWTLGTMGMAGSKFNVISIILISLLTAVGVADSIHLLSDYYQQLAWGLPPESALRRSLAEVLVPCVFTTATTVAGFLSLLVSELGPIRELGLLSAVGVTYAFCITFAFVPGLLLITRPPDPAFLERQRHGLLSRLLARLARPRRRMSIAVLVSTIPIALVSLWLISGLHPRSNPVSYFRPGDPFRVASEAIDEALTGSLSIEFLVRAPGEGMKDPERLGRLEAFQRWLEERIPGARALSAVDSLKEMNRVFHDGHTAQYRLPTSRNLVAQYYLLMEGEDDFDAMIDSYDVGRISTRVRMAASGNASDFFPDVERELAARFTGTDLSVEATGFMKLMYTMEQYLVWSQINSFLVAFGVITLIMAGLLGSIRLALFSMIPNILPIVIGLGFMHAIDLDLDPGTVMIGCVAIGLVVDDTVHFMVRLRRHIAAGSSIETAIEGAMEETGRPIVMTSIILAAGFIIYTAGSFGPTVNFGLIASVVVLLALVGDLVLLPAALIIIRPRMNGTVSD